MTEQEKALYALGLTDEEVAEVLADDRRIDKGEKLFELTDEQKKASKEIRKTNAVDAYGKGRKRAEKVDEEKRTILNALTASVIELLSADDLNIINPEREFEFFVNGKKYKVVLSAPRT